MTTLAKRIEQERLICKMTQEMLAAKAKVSQGLIHKLESGKAKESRKISQIAAALGVNTDWLSTGKGEKYKETKKELNHYPLPGQVNDKLGEWDRFVTKDQLIKAKLVNWSAFCLDTDSLKNIRESHSMIIPNDINPSEKSYIIEIDKDIFKSFTSDTQLLIDPEVMPVKNSIVVLSIGDKIPTLVRWNPGFGELQVEPLESGYPNSISLENKAYTLLGVAVWEQQKGRRP